MENSISYKIEGFEGPLDLLLQLIAKNKLNIYDIPLTSLVDQYLEQIELFKAEEMEIESEFLEMAARLLYIKTVTVSSAFNDTLNKPYRLRIFFL